MEMSSHGIYLFSLNLLNYLGGHVKIHAQGYEAKVQLRIVSFKV